MRREPSNSVRFFDAQFRRQVTAGTFELNAFERQALPYLRGEILDAGCGLGNPLLAAAARGCSVLALDASPAAIEHVRALTHARGLPVRARIADLSRHGPTAQGYDAVVVIGLLMFLDCATARRQLERLKAAVRAGGVAVVNVLIEEGTTWREPFGSDPNCLLGADDLRRTFDGWTLLHDREQTFDAQAGTVKRFATVIARRP